MLRKISLIFLLFASSYIVRGQTIETGIFNTYILCTNGTLLGTGYAYEGNLGITNYSGYTIELPQTIPVANVTKISCLSTHTLLLKNDGTVWAAGNNDHGQLGDGTTIKKTTFFQVPGLSNIVDVSAGNEHSIFLKNDGTVWVCGSNEDGQLGIGSTTDSKVVVQITSLSNITGIHAGIRNSAFIKNNSTVWTCGLNYEGQLGDGTFVNKNSPVQMIGLTNAKAVLDCNSGFAILRNDGTVWACGPNRYGKFGRGNDNKYYPIAFPIPGLSNVKELEVSSNSLLILKQDGTVWVLGNKKYGMVFLQNTSIAYIQDEIEMKLVPEQIAGLQNISKIAHTDLHSVFLDNSGEVYTMGYSQFGILGDGSKGYTMKNNPGSIGDVNNCFVPVAPQVDFSSFPTSLCLGANVVAEPEISGSNPMIGGGVDSSIAVNAPKAICRNNDAVFVLEGNNQIKRYGFDGTLQHTYNTGASLVSAITAITADDNDNVWVSSSTDPTKIYRLNTSGGLFEIQSFYLAGNITSMGFFNYNYTPGNLFILSDDGNLVSVDTSDTDPFTNSNFQATTYVPGTDPTPSMACDNLDYPEKRLLFTDPVSDRIWARRLFDSSSTGGLDEHLLIDSIYTQGKKFDFVNVDTTRDYYNVMLCSSTTGNVALISDSRNANGTPEVYYDDVINSLVNAQTPVGIVSVPFGNMPEFWIADKSKNRINRVRLYVYELFPELPEGLKFNTFTGKIEGTPVNVTGTQTYTVVIHNSLGSDTSTFTFAVNPAAKISNNVGTATTNGNHKDGLSLRYYNPDNCSSLLEIADKVGGNTPGYTSVTQTTYPLIGIIANDTLIRRVNKLRAKNENALQVDINLYYSYEDIKLYNQAKGSAILSNDTIGGTMQMAVLQMHDKVDGSKEPIIHSPVTATWSTANQHWAVKVPVTKFSEFYGSDVATLTTFDCTNTGSDSLEVNANFYVWEFDTLYASGTYIDTLINATGCDSIVTLKLTLLNTGIASMNNQKGILIYPNPTDGKFQIDFNNDAIKPVRIRVTNIIGTEVYNEAVTTTNTTIDLSNYNDGVYYVTVESNESPMVWRITKL